MTGRNEARRGRDEVRQEISILLPQGFRAANTYAAPSINTIIGTGMKGLVGMKAKLLGAAALSLGSAAVLVGCAASTGVLPAGPDTYTLSETFSPARGGGTEAQREALTKANDFCAEKGRVFVPVTMGQSGALYNPNGPTGYTVTFRCLLPTDPAVATYRIQQAPNVIIEQRKR